MTRLTTAPPDYQRVAEAFVHPLKLRIFTLMAQPPPAARADEGTREPGYSPHGLSIALDEPLGTVSYHVHQLEKAGLIELVAVKQRRGALEHYYTLA
jgi:DNA-binding transcriptional ArsR family regulator